MSKLIWARAVIVAVVVLGLSAEQMQAESGFDLQSVSIGTGSGNPEIHGFELYGQIPSQDLFHRALVRNPSMQIIADSYSTGFWWPETGVFGLWSGYLDASKLFPGVYEIEVYYNDYTSDLRRIDVPAHLFSTACPTGFSVVDWWLPPAGEVPQPTFAWDPFQSPQFNPDNEYLNYMAEVIVEGASPEIVCWRGHNISEDVTQVAYNFDGSATPGYDTLPPGSYNAALFAYECQDYLSYSLDVADEYETWRSAQVNTIFTVVPEPATLLLLGLGGLALRRKRRA